MRFLLGIVFTVTAVLAAANPPEHVQEEPAVVTAPRSWGDTFLPKSPPPARTVAAVHHKLLTAGCSRRKNGSP